MTKVRVPKQTNFRKNSKWPSTPPPSSSSENHIAFFSEKPCTQVQNLQFLDWRWHPPPWNFSENSPVLVPLPVPKLQMLRRLHCNGGPIFKVVLSQYRYYKFYKLLNSYMIRAERYAFHDPQRKKGTLCFSFQLKFISSTYFISQVVQKKWDIALVISFELKFHTPSG